jgi:hypothetical protein
MIRRIAFGLVLAVMVLILGAKLTIPSISAQAGRGVTTVKLAYGVIVEEVKVGNSCVVVVSRGGPSEKSEGIVVSGHLAAVPCRP